MEYAKISLLSNHPLFSCLLLLLLRLPLSAISQNSHNITLGSFRTTEEGKSSWVSPSGEFAFGFYQLPNPNLFLLAVWFEKMPKRTIVWCASPSNVDNSMQRGSKVELSIDGQLVLYNHLDEKIWQQEGPAAYAAMLNSGNFVLIGRNSSRLWGSFDEPTDTILPTQKLYPDTLLSSYQTQSDYSIGKFRLKLERDSGNLVLYTTNVPTGDAYNSEGSSSPSLGSGSQLDYSNETGYIGLVQSNGTIFNLTMNNSFMTKDYYHRAVLDFDGVFRQYVHPKTNGTDGTWSVIESIPSDICIAIISYPGSGVCGFNSYCVIKENRSYSCECPPFYSYSNSLEGCTPNFTWHRCDSERPREEQSRFEIREMNNTDWVLSDYELYRPVNEDQCRQSCLDDCLCAVAIFRNATCYKKRLPLSNGRIDVGAKAKALIKVPKNGSFEPELPSDQCKGKRDHTRLVIIGSTLLGSSAFLNFVLLSAISLAIFYSYHRRLLRIHQDSNLLALNMRSFTFKELEEATDGFKEELGRGAFGIVYKGILESDSTNVVAVKRLDKVLVQEGEREFKTEVSVIGQTHHRNLVQMLGFCDEGPHRLLVYEFMSNGSLASFLFDNSRRDWKQRCEIAIGIARGLMYLHEECSTQIIHCDIKPHNILLDDCFTARISDFGLAKLLKTDQSGTDTGIRGTRGYLAPEWFRNLSITVKVDVYSFGIMLLEIICCRRHILMEPGDEEKVILMEWAYKCYKKGRVDMLVEEDVQARKDLKMVERMVMVAIWCVQEDPSLRPSMKRVVRMLTGVAQVAVPMDPFLMTSFH